jgi:hypothetical protein
VVAPLEVGRAGRREEGEKRGKEEVFSSAELEHMGEREERRESSFVAAPD